MSDHHDSYDTDMAEIEMNHVRDTFNTLEEIKQSLKSIELGQNQSVFRHIERLLREATILRDAVLEEERHNLFMEDVTWEKLEEHQAKMQEIKEYINPLSSPTGLCIGYCGAGDFQCYVLMSD